jgi:hypothetical protein
MIDLNFHNYHNYHDNLRSKSVTAIDVEDASEMKY